MGWRAEVQSENCHDCGVDVDARYLERHKHGHGCQRHEIRWDETPNWSRSSEFIAWYGTCEMCGRRLYDCYVAEGPLYDAATDENVESTKT